MNAIFTSDICGNFLYRSDITDPWQVLQEWCGDLYEEEAEFWRQNSSCEIERVYAPDSCSDGYALIIIGDYDELLNRFNEFSVKEI